MFPITCNAIGDIIAVVQLIRDVVVALDDARGAAEEYKQFTRVLSALGTVMGEVYDLATASRNEALKQAVLEEIQLCCIDINNAYKSITGYEKLEKMADYSTRNATHGLFKKLQWHLLRASDAVKYAQRFGESHQRLNSFISLLGHQSTFDLLDEQGSHILASHSHHIQLALDQSRVIRDSAEEIKAAALLALRESAIQSRQQIVADTLSRPYFASPYDRRVASRVQRVADTIFDSLAPDTPRDQRDRFLSLLAPFIVAGAAFMVHNNVSLEWQATGFWTTICALVAQVLWLQSSTPVHPGFGLENGVLLTGLLGEEITVPSHFCSSYEYFHEFLCLFYSKISGAVDFVPCKCYELSQAGTSWLISAHNWAVRVQPGSRMEMGLLRIGFLKDNTVFCPYCDCSLGTHPKSSELICASCSRSFRQTPEDVKSVAWGGVSVAATILARRHGIDWYSALCQMDPPMTALTTSAQYMPYVDIDAAVTFARRCHRVHAINLRYVYVCFRISVYIMTSEPTTRAQDYTPEQLRSASQRVVNALISNQGTLSRPALVYELFRSRIQFLSGRNPDLTVYKCNLRVGMSVHKAVLAELERITTIGDDHGSTPFYQPMTVVQQLLAQMVMALGEYVEHPSEECPCKWDDMTKGY
ncbi:unnamed protein product [Peniophora sp. CBMAI 1063]|nr:unnamed protein product [Peniophora sp. CBMAI 1063]